MNDKDLFFHHEGSVLCYRIIGDPSLRKPILYFHGLPGSRLEASLLHEAALKLGLSIVAFDRPGFGRSTYAPITSPLSLVPLVRRFTEELGFTRFGILAVSGGTPYGLAVASGFPEAIGRTVVVSGPAPMLRFSDTKGMVLPNRIILSCMMRSQLFGSLAVSFTTRFIKYSPNCWVSLLGNSAKPDKSALRDKRLRDMLIQNFHESVKSGGRAATNEIRSMLSAWDFLSSIKSKVWICHGDEDRIVPPDSARRLSEAIPNAELKIFRGEGHLLIADKLEEILGLLA